MKPGRGHEETEREATCDMKEESRRGDYWLQGGQEA